MELTNVMSIPIVTLNVPVVASLVTLRLHAG